MAEQKDDKAETIRKLMAKANDKYRKNTKDEDPIIFSAADRPDLITPKFFSTGIPQLDETLGGGIAKGSLVALHGSPFCGKTCLALTVAAEMTQKKEHVLYYNLESMKLDPYMKLTGIDPNYFHVLEARDFAEQSIDILESLMFDASTRTVQKTFGLIIIDSINNLIPKAAVDKLDKEGSEGKNMAVRAKLIDELFTRMSGRGMLRDGKIVIAIAQDRQNLKSMGPMSPSTVMSGGESVKYQPKLIIKLSRIPTGVTIKGQRVIIGHTVKYVIEKNSTIGSLGTPGEYSVIYGIGLDDSEALFKQGVEWGYIIKDGKTTFRFILPDGDRLVSGGIQAARDFVKTRASIAKALRELYREGKPKTPPQPGTVVDDEETEIPEEAIIDEVTEEEND